MTPYTLRPFARWLHTAAALRIMPRPIARTLSRIAARLYWTCQNDTLLAIASAFLGAAAFGFVLALKMILNP